MKFSVKCHPSHLPGVNILTLSSESQPQFSELLAKKPWGASFGKSPAPDVQMFVKLKEHWPEVDTSLDVRTVNIPSEKREELLNLFTSLLEKKDFIRGDYRELAEISVIMLGGKLPGDKPMVWKKPGATHKARFMAFGLLVLKIFAFSEQEVVKDHCLSDVVVVELEEEGKKKEQQQTREEEDKEDLSLQSGTGGEGGEVLCICSVLLHSHVLHLQLGL